MCLKVSTALFGIWGLEFWDEGFVTGSPKQPLTSLLNGETLSGGIHIAGDIALSSKP